MHMSKYALFVIPLYKFLFICKKGIVQNALSDFLYQPECEMNIVNTRKCPRRDLITAKEVGNVCTRMMSTGIARTLWIKWCEVFNKLGIPNMYLAVVCIDSPMSPDTSWEYTVKEIAPLFNSFKEISRFTDTE